MDFTSRDVLDARLIKTANLSELQGLEEVSNGLAIEYHLHTPVTSWKTPDDASNRMLAELKEVNTEVDNRQDNSEDSIQDRSECRNEKSRSEECRSEESRIDESRQERTHKTRDFLMFPIAIAAMTMMHTPGYNMMTPTLEQGLADVKTTGTFKAR